MTYTPKPGDRVNLAGDDRVWTVEDHSFYYNHLYRVGIALDEDGVSLVVLPTMLTPVAPPLPPEPPVGSVVRAHGRLWLRTGVGYWWTWDTDSEHTDQWSDLATAPDLSPVVAVEDVAEWLDGEGIASPYYLDRFRAKFGGWGQ